MKVLVNKEKNLKKKKNHSFEPLFEPRTCEDVCISELSGWLSGWLAGCHVIYVRHVMS